MTVARRMELFGIVGDTLSTEAVAAGAGVDLGVVGAATDA